MDKLWNNTWRSGTSGSSASHDQNKPVWRRIWAVFVYLGATFNPFPSVLNNSFGLQLSVMMSVRAPSLAVWSGQFRRLSRMLWVNCGWDGRGWKQERSRFVYPAAPSASEAISLGKVHFTLVNTVFKCLMYTSFFLSLCLQTFLRVRANRQSRLNGMYTEGFLDPVCSLYP